jgi:dTDP-4-dehydrorhamnose reductase
MSEILIAGADNILGNELSHLLKKESNNHVHKICHEKGSELTEKEDSFFIDFDKKKAIRRFVLDMKPNIIINCHQNRDISFCEQNKQEARNINVTFAETLSKISMITEGKYIGFSSAQIFDGKSAPYDEEATPNPLNYLGKLMLQMENYVKSLRSNFAIIRYCDYYSPSDLSLQNLSERIPGTKNKGNRFTAFGNVSFSPAFFEDIVNMVFKIIKKDRQGIYNAAPADSVSVYDFLSTAAELSDSKNQIIENTYREGFLDFNIPINTGLVSLKAETDLNMKFTPVKSGLNSLKHRLNKKKRD